MKILVIGAEGQLGQSLRQVSIDFPQHEFLFPSEEDGDVTDINKIEKLVSEFCPAIIVNCAAYTAVDKAESEPELADKINRFGAEILAQAAKRFNVRLIHISTDYVFDGEGREPLKESDDPNPQTVYGRTKLAGERAVEKSDADAVVIRTAWLYSEYGNNFLKTMLRVANEHSIVRVVNDQFGTPTYAPNLARAIVQVAEQPIEGFNILHYSDEGEVTWYDFAKEIFRVQGIAAELQPISTEQYPTAAKRPKYSVLSKDKIKTLGVEVLDWRVGVKSCIEQLNNRQNHITE